MKIQNATEAWVQAMRRVMSLGELVRPRQLQTMELMHHTLIMNMHHPIVLLKERALNYSFAAAEALWVVSGDDQLATLTPYNKRMAEFSDDGVVLAGAYGPRIFSQLDYVTQNLLKDRESRQAVLTTWERNPKPSKDIPCTLALQFMIRRDLLHCHVFMRSSDLWLGVPYDVFTFTMVAAKVACLLRQAAPRHPLSLGRLYLTAGSSHLYEPQWEVAREIINDWRLTFDVITNEDRLDRWRLKLFVEQGRWDLVEESLLACRAKEETQPGTLWQIGP